MKILIIDDEEIIHKQLTDLLAPYGNCDIACNDLEAVDKFNKNLSHHSPYDLIFLDIDMPVPKGMKTLENIRHIEDKNNIKPIDKAFIILRYSARG